MNALGISLAAAVAASTLVVGCNDQRRADGSAQPDNTKVNERDRSPLAVTPMDQSSAPADRDMTQKIRQSVVKTDGLSMDAKNVKIVTAAGVVTLRGPVDSTGERDQVVALAKAAGAQRVDCQLDVKTQ